MAYLKKIEPHKLTPAYNNVISVVYSDNITKEKFQYIFDVLDESNDRIARVKLPANPDGYGVFDAQRILESQVSADIFPSLIGWKIAPNSFAKYSIQYGEEYTSYWTFSDNYFAGNVGFTGTTTHSFEVGDEVYIQQNPTGATNTEYDGVHTVTEVPNAYSFVIDVAFGSSTPPESGTAVYADFRKTTYTGITSSTSNYVVNGGIGHQAFRTYDPTDYIINSATTASMLTTMPDGWTIDNDTQAYVLVHQSGGTNMKYLHVHLSNGADYRISNSNPSNLTQAVGVGSWNINNAGFGTIINSNITSYTAYTENTFSARTSDNIVFNIYEPCSRFEQVQIIAMDRLGSFVGFNFDMKSTKKMDITRSERNAIVGSYTPTSNTWGYNSYDRARIINNIDTTLTYNVASNHIPEGMVDYLAELYSSPEIYWITSSGDWYPIIVKDTTFNYKTRLNDKIINFEMQFELAYKDQVQRG